MGVFLKAWILAHRENGLPHVRGGVSPARRPSKRPSTSSPRAWGCFQSWGRTWRSYVVFPTCVGVFPGLLSAPWLSTGLPHVRGGVSQTGWADIDSLLSSPRAWGCFHFCVGACYHLQVFPTCVGVFLGKESAPRMLTCLPHVRGGVSSGGMLLDSIRLSSPRAWGCFFRQLSNAP